MTLISNAHFDLPSSKDLGRVSPKFDQLWIKQS